MPYSDFSTFWGSAKYLYDIKSDLNKCKQIFVYEGVNQKKYVVKRNFFFLKHGEKDESQLLKAELFIEEKYNQFGLMKLYNASPHSVIPFDFSIIQLPKSNFLIIEILMEYAGVPISNFFPIQDPNLALEYCKQITNAIKFLESFKIQTLAIKPDHILVDNSNDLNIIKFVDIEIGSLEYENQKDEKVKQLKTPQPIYSSPELIILSQNPKPEIQEINPWKCQSYSLGVLMLQLLGFFPNVMNYNDIDKFKI